MKCMLTFQSEEFLIVHNSMKHTHPVTGRSLDPPVQPRRPPPPTNKACQVCGKRIQPTKWIEHANTHFQFPCDLCNLRFDNARDLMTHKVNDHYKFSCQIRMCPDKNKRIFCTQEELDAHFKEKHYEMDYECPFCDVVTQTMAFYINHFKECHLVVAPDTDSKFCPFCQKEMH